MTFKNLETQAICVQRKEFLGIPAYPGFASIMDMKPPGQEGALGTITCLEIIFT